MVSTLSNQEKQPLLPTTKPISENHQTTFKSSSHVLVEEDDRDNVRGYIYMGLSAIGFAVMMVLVRAAEFTYGIPALTSVFIRGCVQTTLATIGLSLTVGLRNGFRSLDARTGSLLVLRGIAGTCGLTFGYLSLKHLPVGQAETIFFFNPIMVMILSYIFLNEPITCVDTFAAIASVIGIALVAQPYTATHDTISASSRVIGSLYSIVAASSASVAYVVIRTISVSVHFFINVLAMGAGCFTFSALFGGAINLDFIQSNKTGTLLVFISALFAFMGQCFLTKGLQHSKAGSGILIRNLDVPIVYFLGLIFLGEVPSFIRLLGSTIVLGSVVAIAINRLLRS